MCGIAGWQFSKGFRPSGAYRSILMAFLARSMDARGGDSFGVAKTNNKGEVKVWKGLGRATGNLYLPSVAQTQQLILHTRKRTHGAINLENAHPLQHGHILGIHNGIVSNHDSLNRFYKRDFELDSKHIFEHLSKGLNVGEIGVYGAISYIDLNTPNVINLCKLSVAGDLEVYGIGSKEDLRGVVFASNKDPIEAALGALKEEYFPYVDIVERRRYYVEDGRFYIDYTKAGELPFGADTLYSGATQTGSRYRGIASFRWTAPEELKLCKPCRRKYKRDTGFKAALLCGSCWARYREILEEERIAAREDDEKAVKAGSGLDPCSTFGCRGKGELGEQHGNELFCLACWAKKRREERITEALQSSVVCPPPLALVKPGSGGESVEEWEGERPVRGRYERLPAELEQWDLCTWCAAEILGRKKWSSAALCEGCTGNWTAMMNDLKCMTKEERTAFRPVLMCCECRKIPTFGWYHKDAFLDDGKQTAKCGPCSGKCILCGEHESKMLYSLTKSGQSIPYCRTCWAQRNAIVPLRIDDEPDAKELEDSVGC